MEGSSDVPTVKEILERHFNLEENQHFRIHRHQGKGKLPSNPLSRPDPKHRGLLDQLPAKLRGYSYLPSEYCVIVLVDADDDDCQVLKSKLESLCKPYKCPQCRLFRIAVEEIESWFLADENAIKTAYPRAKLNKLPPPPPDLVIGAWEKLAEVLGRRRETCDGGDKKEWATKIAPHLDLKNPKSPSLRAFVQGVSKLVS